MSGLSGQVTPGVWTSRNAMYYVYDTVSTVYFYFYMGDLTIYLDDFDSNC